MRMTFHWFQFLHSKRRSEIAAHMALSVSFVVGICFLLGLGPQIQFYLQSAIESAEVNLYATAYNDSLILFPRIFDWFAVAAQYPFILAALAILFATYRSGNVRELFLYVALTCFVALMSIDLVDAIASHEVTIGLFARNVLFNIFGAFFVAGFVLLSCRLVDVLLLSTSLHNAKVLIVAHALWPAFFGFLISTLTYYAVDFVYNPKRAKVEIVSTTPFKAYFSPRGFHDFDIRELAFGEAADEALSSSFGILSRPQNVETPFGLVQSDRPWRLRWMRDAAESAKISIGFYSNCATEKELSALARGPLPFSFYDAREVGVSIDKGLVSFVGNLGSSKSARIYVSDDSSLNGFELGSSAAPDKYYLDQYISDPAFLHYWDGSEPLVFAVGVGMFDQSPNGDMFRSIQKFALRINSREYKIHATPSRTHEADKSVRCHLIRNKIALSDAPVVVTDAGSEFGLVVKIEHSNVQGVYSSVEKNEIIVDTQNGILRIKDLKAEELRYAFSPGSVGFLGISGPKVQFRLNGRTVSSIRSQTYAIKRANLFLRVDATPSLVVSGAADVAFADRTRLNETRWERMDSSVRVSIFGGIITVMLALIGFVGKMLERNEAIYWTSL